MPEWKCLKQLKINPLNTWVSHKQLTLPSIIAHYYTYCQVGLISCHSQIIFYSCKCQIKMAILWRQTHAKQQIIHKKGVAKQKTMQCFRSPEKCFWSDVSRSWSVTSGWFMCNTWTWILHTNSYLEFVSWLKHWKVIKQIQSHSSHLNFKVSFITYSAVQILNISKCECF